MSGASFKKADYRQIARSAGVQAALKALAAKVANQANSQASIADGFRSESEVTPNPDLTVSADSARAYVWAGDGPSIHAEIKNGILLGLADEDIKKP